jgi:hypothetical protein
MYIRIRSLRAALILLALSSGAARAGVIPVDWVAVDAAVLEQARGGFTLPSGLAVAIGIERTVAVNGQVVARTHFDIPDVRLMTPEQAQQTRDAMSSVILVQNGVNGVDRTDLSGTIGAMVIQNTLNDQHIETRTVIDASVNTLAGFKAINFQATLGDALARAAAGH